MFAIHRLIRLVSILIVLVATTTACEEESASDFTQQSNTSQWSDDGGTGTDAAATADAGPDNQEPTDDSVSQDGLEDSPWVQPVAQGEWEWLIQHDGEGAGSLLYNDAAPEETPCTTQEDCPEDQFCHAILETCRVVTVPDAYYEYVRFEVFQPFRIRTLRVQVEVSAATTLTVYIWDDLGGNFLHPNPEEPLAVLSREVTPDDSGQWLELPVEPAIVVSPGRLVYPGVLLVDGATPRFMHDGAQEEIAGKPFSSLVWFSKDIEPTDGTHTVFSAASGDFMLEMEIQRFDIVQDDAFVFEPIDPEESTVPGISRGALRDVDGDGDLDLMVNGPSLFLNDGTGNFTGSDGLPGGLSSSGGVFGDYDNDGDPDFLIAGGVDFLLRNDGGVFVDVTAESGIDDSQRHTCNGVTGEGHVPTETVTWIDVDRDGWLDAYVAGFICWEDGLPAKDKIFRNQGDGTFIEANEAMWVAYGQGGSGYAARGTAPADYDGDGFTDLLVTNYRLHPNLFWHNQGDGTLKQSAQSVGVQGTPGANTNFFGHSIGATWGDFDHDDDLDLFIANLAHPRFLEFSDKATLYRNTGGEEAVMLDVTENAGIRYQETASDPVSWDYDNDGDLDLFWTCVYEHRPSQFYRNEWPSNQWKEVTYPTGLVVDNGWGMVTGDIDNDGDLDLLARTAWRNRNPWGRKSLQLRPRGQGAGFTNRDGIGARITVMVDGTARMQEAVASRGTTSQDSPWLHFGLGDAEAADVTIVFPASGESFSFPQLSAGRYTLDEDGGLSEDP